MTHYSYKIIFTDSEIAMLETALQNMLEHCQEELDKGAGAPFYAHKRAAREVLDRMYDNSRLVIGRHFDPES